MAVIVPDEVERQHGAAEVAVLCLAAVLGAGVFAVWGPAAAASGSWLPVAVLLAAAAAYCTTASVADLVVAGVWRTDRPDPGTRGAGPPEAVARFGRVAFLAARTAAAAAVAAVFGSYVLPSAALPTAVVLIVAVTVAHLVGLRWTTLGLYTLVGGTVAVLLFVIVTGLLAGGPPPPAPVGPPADAAARGWGAWGVTGAAGFVSFAFAGVACLGGTAAVTAGTTARTLRRGPVLALAVGTGLMLLLTATLLIGLGAERLAMEAAPLAALVDAGRAPALGVLVRVGAAVVTAAALLAVLGELAGTIADMARCGELPAGLAVSGSRGRTCRALLAGGAVAVVVVWVAGQAGAIAVAAICVLLAHAVVNLVALRLPGPGRWRPLLGLVLCLALAASMPLGPLVVSLALVAIGWAASTVRVTT